tara:strand:- start:959 stop:1150 length:192 start_codon:yes stop_codon:yes gene_type:complete
MCHSHDNLALRPGVAKGKRKVNPFDKFILNCSVECLNAVIQHKLHKFSERLFNYVRNFFNRKD